MNPSQYGVVGKPKAGGKALLLRRFDGQEDAMGHAQKVDRSVWDEVWVVPLSSSAKPEPTEAPPFPWNVLWSGGYAYVIDANGKKIMSLLGPQKQREFVADIIRGLGAKRAEGLPTPDE